MKFKKGVVDDHEDNFAIVFAAMGVSIPYSPTIYNPLDKVNCNICKFCVG